MRPGDSQKFGPPGSYVDLCLNRHSNDELNCVMEKET